MLPVQIFGLRVNIDLVLLTVFLILAKLVKSSEMGSAKLPEGDALAEQSTQVLAVAYSYHSPVKRKAP